VLHGNSDAVIALVPMRDQLIDQVTKDQATGELVFTVSLSFFATIAGTWKPTSQTGVRKVLSLETPRNERAHLAEPTLISRSELHDQAMRLCPSMFEWGELPGCRWVARKLPTSSCHLMV
jgi:hypothetical protein